VHAQYDADASTFVRRAAARPRLRYGPGTVPVIPAPLTQATLELAVLELAARDSDLAAIVERFGPPPLWDRPAGFPTLVHMILEQQVSLASAQAAFDRLGVAADPLTPDRFLGLDDVRLLAVGFSRQKAGYVRNLARAIASGDLDLTSLAGLADEDACGALVALPGIGPWTASIYLIEVLLRPDVWPVADLALVSAVAHVKRLADRPGREEMRALAEPWRPWRSVAARLFWHDYLSRRRRNASGSASARGVSVE
jgi:DNA-3-methyladenine glycosylase II